MRNSTLTAIGYWYSEFEPELPKPQDFICNSISEVDKKQLTDYLNRGQRLHEWMGYSACRFGCKLYGPEIGNACLTDGVYIWPEGLPHYITKHQVWLPHEFVNHVWQNYQIIEDRVDINEDNFGNYDWWKSFKSLHERTTEAI